MSSKLDNVYIEGVIVSLKNNMSNLNANNANFASNLIRFYDKNKKFSYKQIFWAEKLSTQIDNNVGSQTKMTKENNEIEVGKLTFLENMFEKAKDKTLKYPGVMFNVTDVGIVTVTVPEKDSDEGLDVMIKVGVHRPNRYVGTVVDEIFYPYNDWYKLPDRVVELLKKLSEDTKNTLLEYGKGTDDPAQKPD